jgi:hypothetical protein
LDRRNPYTNVCVEAENFLKTEFLCFQEGMEEEDDTQWSWNVEYCLSLEMMTLVKIKK